MEKTYKILKLLNWILTFGVVIVGASVLYNRLSDEVSVGGIATVAQETAAAEETVAPGETTPETQEVSNLAPDFTVYDLEGNAHKSMSGGAAVRRYPSSKVKSNGCALLEQL